MDDILILGGGVIGLSLAYELAGQGVRVHLLERQEPGREASWAGAGILPAAPRANLNGSHDQLAALSHDLHPQWAARLKEETGLDTGFRRCGGVYVARNVPEAELLQAAAQLWRDQQISVETLNESTLAELEPAVASAPCGRAIQLALLLAGDCQLRNPRHLKALALACQRRGARITSGVPAEGFEIRGGRVRDVRSPCGTFAAEAICVTSGSWSGALLAQLGIRTQLKPVRGQIVLLLADRPTLRRVVNEGARYLVPRDDGRVLVGSTEEDAGFDKRTTAEGVAGLLRLAVDLVPQLAAAQLERAWAGLRPATVDRLPLLGRVRGLDNAFVATGHFRSGLYLSTGTAVAMSQLIRGETPAVDLEPFRVDRPSVTQEPGTANYA